MVHSLSVFMHPVNNENTSREPLIKSVTPALRQAQDKLAFGQAGVQFIENTGFRPSPDNQRLARLRA
jgi:hypothetical protein